MSKGHNTSIPGATIFPFGLPPKNFRSRARGHFLGLTPGFGRFGLVSRQRYSYFNFSLISTKLDGTVRAIKKMTQNDNGLGPGRNHGETAAFTFGRKVVFGLKMGFTPKNHPK